MAIVTLPYQFGQVNGERYYIAQARHTFGNIKPGFMYLVRLEEEGDTVVLEAIQFLSHQHLLSAEYADVAEVERDWQFFPR